MSILAVGMITPPSGSVSPSPIVHYHHIFENPYFSMGVFVLPPRAKIPLHDHPGMNVVSSLLYGQVETSMYTVAKNHESGRGGLHVVSAGKVVLDSPSLLSVEPEERNVHEYMAGADIGCAIFDIIFPPYDSIRHCTYYAISSPNGGDGTFQLVPTIPDCGFECRGGRAINWRKGDQTIAGGDESP